MENSTNRTELDTVIFQQKLMRGGERQSLKALEMIPENERTEQQIEDIKVYKHEIRCFDTSIKYLEAFREICGIMNMWNTRELGNTRTLKGITDILRWYNNENSKRDE